MLEGFSQSLAVKVELADAPSLEIKPFVSSQQSPVARLVIGLLRPRVTILSGDVVIAKVEPAGPPEAAPPVFLILAVVVILILLFVLWRVAS